MDAVRTQLRILNRKLPPLIAFCAQYYLLAKKENLMVESPLVVRTFNNMTIVALAMYKPVYRYIININRLYLRVQNLTHC